MPLLDHVSHSQVNMWLRCPRQWEFRYVKGLKMPPSGALIEGGCYHRALEVNFRQKITSFEDLAIDECLDVYSDEWEKRLIEEESVDWGNKHPGTYKDEGYSLVTEYIASTAFSVQPISVEEITVSEVAGVTFVCIPDLVDIRKIVIDHKTSARSYNQDDVDKDIQASAEAFVLGRPIVFHNHVAIKSKVPRIQVVKSYRTRADIEWWEDMAAKVVSQMKTGVAPPNPIGWHCSPRFCGFYELCRLGLARSVFV